MGKHSQRLTAAFGYGKAPSRRGLITGWAAAALLAGGGAAVGAAALSQRHAPQPAAAQAGTTGPSGRTVAAAAAGTRGLTRSRPVRIGIPAIGVRSWLLTVGLNRDGTMGVPPLFATPSEAAWFDGSPTPGQIGTAVIDGHVDTFRGPSVFFRLGALRPGATVDVMLADGVVAVFRVTGVRTYAKDEFPALTVYQDTPYPSLRLVTCGGDFDHATGQYLGNTVVFAWLVSHHRVRNFSARRPIRM